MAKDNTETRPASNIKTTYFVRHCDPNSTGEGLGSHARGTVYPLVRVQEAMEEWKILWQHSEQACWSAQGNTTRPEYEEECKDLGDWLGFTDRFEDIDRNTLQVVNIDLDVDPRLGRILGSVKILIDSIQDYIHEYGEDKFYCRMPSFSSYNIQTVLISLNGRFQYRDDPSPSVLSWMQGRGQKWRSERLIRSDSQPRTLNIVGHIRVPEDYCSQEWKDANSMDHLLTTLDVVHRILQHQLSKNNITATVQTISLEVFTEACFPESEEARLSQDLSSKWIPLLALPDGRTLPVEFHLHRQTPLLACVQSMASADILIPASSFLSAFAAFFHPSLVVLPNEGTRHDKYFAPHILHSSYHTNSEESSIENINKCPLVRVEEEDILDTAISNLLVSLGRL